MVKMFYDADCNLSLLDGKTVAVIGFGSQGHAHSENLAESGVNVVVGLRKGSAHWEKASEFAATHENFKVMEVEEAAKAGDVVMMLVPRIKCATSKNTPARRSFLPLWPCISQSPVFQDASFSVIRLK